MKFLPSLLRMGLTVIFCLSLLSPLAAMASSSKKATPASHAVQEASSQNQKGDKDPDRKAVEENAKNPVDSDRSLWLKRARESEIYTGKASWYGRDFHNKKTASGLPYDMYTFTAAHRTLPLGTVVKVTDEHNGKSVMVCVTDRGPYVHGRIIDLSYAAAEQLDLQERGVGKVRLEVVSDEKGTPLKNNQAYFVEYSSENGKSKVGPFTGFADAAAMHEALLQAHPEAEVILDKTQAAH